MTKVTTVGIDLAKSVFQVHGGEARACSCGRRAESQSVASEASGGAANVQHADTDREIAPPAARLAIPTGGEDERLAHEPEPEVTIP